MTRSMKIPEEARDKAAAELYGAMGGAHSQWVYVAPQIQDHYRELADLMLEAALPYLAKSTHVLVCSNCEGCDVCCGDNTIAPAVPQPGGLREALEKLAGEMEYDSSDGGARILSVLAAHPVVTRSVEIPEAAIKAAAQKRADHYESEYDSTHLKWQDFASEAQEILEAAFPYLAPAVPQPVDREALCNTEGPRGRGNCVFVAGHHEGDAWTSHADKFGWTWNSQPADDE